MGRPTKYDDAKGQQIATLLRGGCTRKAAVGSVGVAYPTFLRWLTSNVSFVSLVESAEAECAVKMTTVITQAAFAGDPRYALEWLKRRNPDEWSDSLNLTKKSDTDLLSEALAVLQRAGAGGAGGSDPAGADPFD